MKDWLDSQPYQVQSSIYFILGVTGLIILCWFWSLLFSIFFPSTHLPNPLLAPNLLLHYKNNSAKTNIILVVTFLIPTLFFGIIIIGGYQNKKLKTLFGNAHWASMSEIRKMGFLNNEGLIIGDKHGKLLRAKLVSHALIFAPSRSGKGVSQVIPNALAFTGSLLCIDIKLEIFLNTSGFRQKHGQSVYLFSPANLDGKTHRWNPLDLISRHPARMISDLQLVTNILIHDGSDEHSMWVSEARSLAVGLLLWLAESGRPFTLGELSALVKGTVDFVNFLIEIINNSITEDGTTTMHPIAFMNINNFVQKAEKERSGVKSTITARLNLWDDPLINAATNHSDFNVRDMRRKRMTVYLGIPTNHLARLAPLMNLFIQLFVNALAESLPGKDEPHKILVMLDEFCALGRMDTLKAGFGFLAGYNIHLMAIIQNVGQFFDLYGGRDQSDIFFQNTDYKIAYRQNAVTDTEFVSSQLGMTTQRNSSKSYPGGILNCKLPSTNESVIARPLLSPDQVRVFPHKQAIAIISGESPIRFRRIIYYKDIRFKDRILPSINIVPITPSYPIIQAKKIEQPNSEDSFVKKDSVVNKITEFLTLQQSISENRIPIQSGSKNVLPDDAYDNLDIED